MAGGKNASASGSKKPKGALKKPLTAYQMFVKSRLNEGTVEGSDCKERIREVARQWRECSDDERQKLEQLALKDRARYRFETDFILAADFAADTFQ